MNQISDFFGAPPVQVRPIIQPQIIRQVRNEGPVLKENIVNQGQKVVPQVIQQKIPREVECPPIMMVNRNQDVDQAANQVR